MRKIIIGGIIVSLTGCANFNFLNKDESVVTPEKYKTTNLLIKENLSEIEKNEKMKNWWGQFNDPVLSEVINKSQENSPSIATAIVNIKNHEAILESNIRKTSPNVSLSGSVERYGIRGYDSGTYSSLGLTTSWELDLFGKNELIKKSNIKNIENAKASWHDAKTMVAAEAARTYFNYNFCQKSLGVLNEDYEAKKSQNEIIKLKVNAGFEAKSSLFQTEAGLAQSEANILATESQCKGYIKSLVALTAMSEDYLNDLLQKTIKDPHNLELFVPVNIPGNLIYQRPDIFNSMNNIKIASLGYEKTKLDALPEISISGNISSSLSSIGGVSTSGNNWSIGPLTIYLPIFNSQLRKVNEDLAKLQYEQTKLQFYSDLRNAIKEVEVSMINLNSHNERLSLLEKSVNNYKKLYLATKQKYEVGLASLFELEDVRRQLLSETKGQINNELDKVNSWIDLYKAVGGGFTVIGGKDEIKQPQ